MATDYISREAAKRAIQKALYDGTGYGEALNKIPAADVRPVVHSRWIYDCERTLWDGWTYRQYHCEKCGRQEIGGCQIYCPNCGADMREETEK